MFFEMKECQTDKNWAHIYKIEVIKNVNSRSFGDLVGIGTYILREKLNLRMTLISFQVHYIENT